MSRDIAFLVPLAMAHESVTDSQNAGQAGPASMGELLIWSLESALDWAVQATEDEALSRPTGFSGPADCAMGTAGRIAKSGCQTGNMECRN